MKNHFAFYQEEKSRSNKVKKYVGKSQANDPFTIHTFEESSRFPIGLGVGHRDEFEIVFSLGHSASCLKRAFKFLNSFFVPDTNPSSQPTINSKWKKIEKEVGWECIARWWYDAYVLFNATNSTYYYHMIDAIVGCGLGFKAPIFHDTMGSLLENEVQMINEYLIDFKESWNKIRCTIMFDGWIHGRSHTIMNFLMDHPNETMFPKSMDASNQVKDAQSLFFLLDEIFVEVRL
jgi:hypothetical protein